VTIQSMTGFARTSGTHEEFSWLWEVKSVNGRGLEVRCRLPFGYDTIEETARKELKKLFRRGSMNLHLQLNRDGKRSDYQINEELLDLLIDVAKDRAEKGDGQPANMDGLLSVKGVVELAEQTQMSDEDREALETVLLADLRKALKALHATRTEEGVQLTSVINAQIDEIERLITLAKSSSALRPEKQRERMARQLNTLLEGDNRFDEARLEQELALLATKADISEELDRLDGHVETVRGVLNGDTKDGIGRRLDFICQEFNREANTLCSKSNDKELTQIGLDLKVVVDRFREQVQNIE
jgi:uncharacterized protein (TIGR00255 family)